MVNPQILAEGYFVWWQIPLVLLLVLVIIFYVMYRKKQM